MVLGAMSEGVACQRLLIDDENLGGVRVYERGTILGRLVSLVRVWWGGWKWGWQ